jgi:hypothetical protein
LTASYGVKQFWNVIELAEYMVEEGAAITSCKKNIFLEETKTYPGSQDPILSRIQK